MRMLLCNMRMRISSTAKYHAGHKCLARLAGPRADISHYESTRSPTVFQQRDYSSRIGTPAITAGLVDKIEINCDMGEGFGRWKMGPDEKLMNYIDAANIACGFHAGDPTLMLQTVRLAAAHHVKAGAHPGLEDKFGFGRRRMEIDPEDMYASVLYQVGALKAMLDAEGMPLNHIKPHGELFFYMQRDMNIMRAVLRACAVYKVPVYACKNDVQRKMCGEVGLPFQEELYVDTDYTTAGGLVPVAKSKAVTPELIEKRILAAMEKDERDHNEGGVLKLGFNGAPFSICLHSDMPTALENARVARKVVDEANERHFPDLEGSHNL